MRLATLFLLIAAPLAAQNVPQLPADWKVRPDRANADLSTLSFETMPPGWHVTTGPSLILWNPSMTATGNFTVTSEVFFFREKSRDTEAYGILVGGKDLEGEGQAYTYFLLRNDGKFMVRHRAGAATHTIADWTAHDAVARHTAETKGATAKNVLSVQAKADSVHFLVNGQQVGTWPRAGMQVDGIVGLRVNHGLNLHWSKLEIGR
ncbi:MAG TPA: hypothetical protein VF862_02070 [Gemmatimonadales bacterium]